MSADNLIRPVVRRAILDLLQDIGGEQNDDVIARLLTELGHRVARRDVAKDLQWLAEARLVTVEMVGPFVVAEILPDGIDVAEGRLKIEGVHRHRTGR